MKTINVKMLQVAERVIRKEVEKNLYGWPPVCSGIFHQPKRPTMDSTRKIE